MKITKRLVAASAALTLALGGTATAIEVSMNTNGTAGGTANSQITNPNLGTVGASTNVSNQEFAAQGHTTVSIMQAAEAAPANISFEVPLYVTLAVINNTTDVQAPNNYKIKNTSQQPDTKIGVTQMVFEKLQGSTYNTVDTDTAATNGNNNDIYLTIGGLKMPALTNAGSQSVDVKGTGSVFYEANKYKAIAPQGEFDVTIVGKVKSAARQNEKAAAQFRVIYQVSPLDAQGNPLGYTYAGDSSVDAGLGQWTAGGFQRP